mgnify:FL=1
MVYVGPGCDNCGYATVDEGQRGLFDPNEPCPDCGHVNRDIQERMQHVLQ